MELPSDGEPVYVPARPVHDLDDVEPAIELRRLESTDERVGLAFSSVEALVKTLGDAQPWVRVGMYEYVAWLRAQGVYRIQVDPSYRSDVREWTAEDLFYASGSD